ncbi:MAG TPA: protein translocase subunit SecF [Kribbellaceae bacterium]|nr:protein translocase subunit SecF [Kribbellaceae bacterium]
MSKLGSLGAKLYRGEASYSFIGHRKLWFGVSITLVLIAIASLAIRGLSLGIEFKGGVDFIANVKVTHSTVEDFRSLVRDTHVEGAQEPVVTTIGDKQVRVQTKPLDQDGVTKVRTAIADKSGDTSVDYSQIGASWGGQITNKAITALIVFIVIVFFVIWLAFREPKMSAAALIALVHDVLITIGLYALSGFEVTPATVIGVLTILGYSLYDTVVVFDKVRENTRGIAASNRYTYSDAANLAVNQTIVRSVNTTLIALLPVGAILFVGVWVLGSGPLKDLSMALFVGIAVGAYSSIFIAPSLLAIFKEREPAMRALSRRVRARAGVQDAVPAAAGAPAATAKAATAADGPQDAPAEKPERPTAGSITLSAPRPMNTSSARRPQPSRKPRSKRGK